VKPLRCTLVSDGSSDAALLPILTWLLRQNGLRQPIQMEWADLRQLRWRTKPTLADKIRQSIVLYPCELLFVHRDAERERREKRVQEIETALSLTKLDHHLPLAICVVPVRMQEAWLLFDEAAIKFASGNRTYPKSLDLPALKDLELLPDPKTELHERLRLASGLTGRRLRSFSPSQRAQRLPDFISDFAPLRGLPAFAALEDEIRLLLQRQGWDQ